jgi:hypothetical protein
VFRTLAFKALLPIKPSDLIMFIRWILVPSAVWHTIYRSPCMAAANPSICVGPFPYKYVMSTKECNGLRLHYCFFLHRYWHCQQEDRDNCFSCFKSYSYWGHRPMTDTGKPRYISSQHSELARPPYIKGRHYPGIWRIRRILTSSIHLQLVTIAMDRTVWYGCTWAYTLHT